jgi:hypothetical protein
VRACTDGPVEGGTKALPGLGIAVNVAFPFTKPSDVCGRDNISEGDAVKSADCVPMIGAPTAVVFPLAALLIASTTTVRTTTIPPTIKKTRIGKSFL